MTGFSGGTGWAESERSGERLSWAALKVSRLGKCVAAFVNLRPRRVKSVSILVKNKVILTKSEGVLVGNMGILVKSAGVLTKEMGVFVKKMVILTKSEGVLVKNMVILTKSTAILAKNTGVLRKSKGIPTLFRHNFVNSVNSVKNTRSVVTPALLGVLQKILYILLACIKFCIFSDSKDSLVVSVEEHDDGIGA